MNKKIILALISFGALCISSSALYAADDASPMPKISESWRFEVTPYAWVPGIQGTLGLNNGLAKSVDVSSSNVVSNIKSGGMIAAEAHYGNWGVIGDLVSATLQETGTLHAPPSVGSVTLADKATLQQTVLTGAATYTALNDQNIYLDGLLGVRAIYATATVNLNLPGTTAKASTSATTSTVDPIIGFKGRYRIADSSWYLPFYADIGSGGGTTNLTWQAMAGIGKTFSPLIDASLTYRALYYDMKDGAVLQKTTMQGPQIAVTFKF
jgi:hypothetical protein